MTVSDVVSQIEANGAALRLDGDRVRIRFPGPRQRDGLAEQVAFLRLHKKEVANFLRLRSAPATLPPGVRLLSWNLKNPPVAIETCSVVTSPALFALTTLEQLREAMANPRRWVGWSI